jgi:Periplasmic binding protein
MKQRQFMAGAAALPMLSGLSSPRARAHRVCAIKLGVLGDMSGLYHDISGPTSVACVRQAVQDSGLAARGFTVEVLVGDHQNRTGVGSSIARKWFDEEGVSAVVDVPNSGVALAVNSLIREKNSGLLPGTFQLRGRPAILLRVYPAFGVLVHPAPMRRCADAAIGVVESDASPVPPDEGEPRGGMDTRAPPKAEAAGRFRPEPVVLLAGLALGRCNLEQPRTDAGGGRSDARVRMLDLSP